MRQTRLSFITVGLVAIAAVSWPATSAHAQNDWQYPDPYFGILEIEKSHDGATARRYRGEVNPAPRPSKTAAATPAPATPTPTPVPRNRWRNRWRRQ
jgi:hypothetical protein